MSILSDRCAESKAEEPFTPEERVVGIEEDGTKLESNATGESETIAGKVLLIGVFE